MNQHHYARRPTNNYEQLAAAYPRPSHYIRLTSQRCLIYVFMPDLNEASA